MPFLLPMSFRRRWSIFPTICAIMISFRLHFIVVFDVLAACRCVRLRCSLLGLPSCFSLSETYSKQCYKSIGFVCARVRLCLRSVTALLLTVARFLRGFVGFFDILSACFYQPCAHNVTAQPIISEQTRVCGIRHAILWSGVVSGRFRLWSVVLMVCVLGTAFDALSTCFLHSADCWLVCTLRSRILNVTVVGGASSNGSDVYYSGAGQNE
jgi:hypothetical protein